VDLLISTRNGKANSVAKGLLLVYVGKSIGEHTIDLRAEIIIKDNAQLLEVLEKVKAMEGINDAIWSEVVEVVGRKRSIPSGPTSVYQQPLLTNVFFVLICLIRNG
jgi:hypothetical protein